MDRRQVASHVREAGLLRDLLRILTDLRRLLFDEVVGTLPELVVIGGGLN